MIDKNIPLPDGGMATHYRDMQVGDSIFLPNDDPRHKGMSASAISATRGAAKFSQRKVDGGIRLWRTA